MPDYQLLDSGGGRKLERFGPVVLSRPAAQAVWRPSHPALWKTANAVFERDDGNRWERRDRLPDEWVVGIEDIRFRLSSTDFGHLGVFPEQRLVWRELRRLIREGQARERRVFNVLNLFAYSGGSTLAAAQAGAAVCHLDASQGMVQWARQNAELNGLAQAPIRWIVDDVKAFLRREARRRRYDGLILDPPSFGRGRKGQIFKLEEDIQELLDLCKEVLEEQPSFVVLSCHTPEFTPQVLANLLRQWMGRREGRIESGELLLTGSDTTLPLPSGTHAWWKAGRAST